MSQRIRLFSVATARAVTQGIRAEFLIFEVLTVLTGWALTELRWRCLPCRPAALFESWLAPFWSAGWGLHGLCWLQVHALVACAGCLGLAPPGLALLVVLPGCCGVICLCVLCLLTVPGSLGLLRLSEPGWLFWLTG